jgi:hypothetical protein
VEGVETVDPTKYFRFREERPSDLPSTLSTVSTVSTLFIRRKNE